MLVAVAALDAVRKHRGGGEEAAPPRVDAGGPVSLPVELLRRAAVRGLLVWTDADCELHALRLPEGRRAPPPEGPDVGCEFELSPNGRRVAPRGSRWGTSAYYALCRGTVVDVYWPPSGRAQYSYDGCAPAWRPTRDGPLVLTLARDDEVLEVRPACEPQPPCEEVVLDRSDIAAARDAVTDPSAVSAADVLALDWQSPQRLRALLLLRLPFGASRRIVATYDAGELAFVEPFGPKPFHDDGATVAGGRVVVAGIELPIRAGDAAFARERSGGALAGTGLSGTLVYTTSAGCELRAVRLPSLEPVEPPRRARRGGCGVEHSARGVLREAAAASSSDAQYVALCSAVGTRVTDTRTGAQVDADDGCAATWRAPDGARWPIPHGFGDVRAGAFSADRRWLALAARGAIVLLRADELRRFSETGRPPEPIKLPLDAADLAWR